MVTDTGPSGWEKQSPSCHPEVPTGFGWRDCGDFELWRRDRGPEPEKKGKVGFLRAHAHLQPHNSVVVLSGG